MGTVLDSLNILDIRDLEVSYGERKVLEGFNLTLPAGKIAGLLGPNGAGKTTLVKTIIGLKRPSRGSVRLGAAQERPGDLGFLRNLGVVPQELAICPELTAWENLLFFGSLFGLSGAPFAAHARELLDQVGLSDRAHQLAGEFSGGMQRRLNLAVSVVHQPKLLILDEPTVGVDPQSRFRMLELLKAWNRDGMSILYTSHFLDEAERLCDDLVIMDHGKILAHGALKDLLSPLPTRISLEIPESECDSLRTILAAIAGLEWKGRGDDGRIYLEMPQNSAALKTMVDQMEGFTGALQSLEAEKPRLETLFLRLTGRQFRDE